MNNDKQNSSLYYLLSTSNEQNEQLKFLQLLITPITILSTIKLIAFTTRLILILLNELGIDTESFTIFYLLKQLNL